MRTHDKTSVVTLLPADVQAATRTTNDFDISAYYGQGKFILDGELQGSGITNIVKIQHSNLAVGASMATVGDADVDLNLSTGGKTKLAATFTQSGVRQVKYVDLILKKTGTIASDKTLTLTIEADSSGDPSGTPLATAGTVLANTVDDGYMTVRFTLTTPLALADATAYWIVLTSNYTASDTNFISWYVTTVASGGTLSRYAPSTWTAVTTQDPLFTIQQFAFADATGGTFTTLANVAAATHAIGLDLDSLGSHIRAVSTVAGGSSVGAVSLILVAPTQNV
jgi:hypothetical protein